jgi:isoleucyl-tRNA synthetase
MSKLVKEAARSWTSTLRLPKSSFPARPLSADLTTYLRKCTDDLYQFAASRSSSKPPFVLHDGPPYANGGLHAGHALNKILKDIICRAKLAEGRRVSYIPGWDCHGLPIELKALEHHGWNTQQQNNAVVVRQAAREFASDTVEKQMQGFRSWGIMADWSNHWKTMDKDYELRQLSVFRAMAQKGLIYRRRKPVYWSPSSQTALAEAELEYKEDHISTAALVKFPIAATPQWDRAETTYAVIWTTTPWTLPANQAIAYSEGLQYLLVRSPSHGLLLIAKARLAYVESLLGEQLQIVDEHITNDQLRSMTYRGPQFLDITSTDRPFFDAGFVTSETGTGLVHCAPGHGMEDYEALQPLIRAARVDVKAPVDDLGCFTEDAAPNNPQLLVGKEVFNKGNNSVLRGLNDEGLLLARHQYMHKYPYDWRTKQPIMIRATAQWFADISSIKENTVSALKDVDFRPQTGYSRLKSFVENRNEWCISRQRAWGVPIPALYHRQTDEPVLSDESISHIMKLINERGIDAWWSDSSDDPAWICPSLTAANHRRGIDTMDVWFDSGTSWMHMLKGKEIQTEPLADIYIEGTDQHRGWFQSSLLTNVAFQKSINPDRTASAPFRTLVTHGFTLDGEGKKMSKSIGNVVSPEEIISGVVQNEQSTPEKPKKRSNKNQTPLSLGPDALRLWVASSDWTKDVIVSQTIVQTVHAALHKYRVTFKLLLGALQDFNLDDIVAYTELSKVDQMALLHLHQVASTVRSSFDNLEFYKAVTAINRWVNADFSGLYMEASKDILYCEAVDSHRRLSVQTVLYHILCQMQGMLGPLLPILIEETWAHTPVAIQNRIEHPLRHPWDVLPLEWNDSQLAENELPIIMAINAAVKSAQEKARSEKKMGSSLESDVELRLDAASIEIIDSWLTSTGGAPALQELLVVSRLDILSMEAGTFREVVAEVKVPSGLKCSRCWKYNVDSLEADVPDCLCSRCQNVVGGLNKD